MTLPDTSYIPGLPVAVGGGVGWAIPRLVGLVLPALEPTFWTQVATAAVGAAIMAVPGLVKRWQDGRVRTIQGQLDDERKAHARTLKTLAESKTP